ncbi:hypothetical protein M885DRAFT_279697 [Pelagophyceae sp. CCMP2097]|nr:hypothetical protein M885DRAFT_279697 [Pelagophyceae sp. CCMP2097]
MSTASSASAAAVSSVRGAPVFRDCTYCTGASHVIPRLSSMSTVSTASTAVLPRLPSMKSSASTAAIPRWSSTSTALRDSTAAVAPVHRTPVGRDCVGAHLAGAHVVARWRFAIVVGIALASGLCAAFTSILSQELIDVRDRHRSENYACRVRRDVVTGWGKRLAVEAETFGSLVVRERALSLVPKTPFYVPGPLSSAQQIERLVFMAEEFDQRPPTVIWYPTVRLEDRAAYEAYAGEAYGMAGPINITDDGAETIATAVAESSVIPVLAPSPAPPRETYNPFLFMWTDQGAALASELVQQLVGVDVQETRRRTLPAALQARIEDQKLIAHLYYQPSGDYLPDFILTVQIPVVGKEGFFDEELPPVLGYVSFTLHVDQWSFIFPEHVKVIEALTGNVVKTVSGYSKHTHVHEPFLGLDLECFYNFESDAGHCIVVVILSFLAIALQVVALWRLERGAGRERRLVDEQRREEKAAEERRNERIRYSFEISEKTERYLNHELKNRIFVLGHSCADQSLQPQIEEITEVLNSKAALMRLSTGRYEPSWDACEPVSLIDVRWQRFVAAHSPFERVPTTGAAANRTTLQLDKILFDIIVDSMLSNAFKYGDVSRPPSMSLNVEPLDDGATRVKLSLELRNWAGPEHAALLRLGEEALNEIALTEGMRAHDHAAELSSGDDFPMAGAAANALGGSVRLVLLEDGVIAKLELPDVVAVLPGVSRNSREAAPVELSKLSIAMADDSATFRKAFAKLAEKLTSRKPIAAGATRESIDDFPKTIVENDCDVRFNASDLRCFRRIGLRMDAPVRSFSSTSTTRPCTTPRRV